MPKFQYLIKSGSEIRPYILELAELRIKVFYEFPYLYEGSFEYESKYLEKYLNSDQSLCVIVQSDNRIVGASTGLPLAHEDPDVLAAFKKDSSSIERNFYFGESVLLNEFRGLGIGKIFFQIREKFARSLHFSRTSFCSVFRPENHPLRPLGYRPLDLFWASLGYEKMDGALAKMNWLDRGESKETEKSLQFWKKDWYES